MSRLRKFVKPWTVMPLVAVLCMGAWYIGSRAGDDNGTPTAAAPRTVAATVGDMSQTVSAEGAIAHAETEDLSFAVSGTVTAVNVKAGDQVTVGQVLASVDATELQAAVVDADAALAGAKATLADHTSAGASAAQLDADNKAVTAATDRLADANENLADANLVAGMAGTISSVDVTVGEQLGSNGASGTDKTGSQSGTGQTAGDLGSGQNQPGGTNNGDTGNDTTSAHIQVVSAGHFIVKLGFTKSDIDKLAVGQSATISLASSSSRSQDFFFPGGARFGGGQGTTRNTTAGSGDSQAPVVSGVASVTGRVTEIGTSADASSGVAKYPVTVAFDDSSGDYNAGANSSVAIGYSTLKNVVQVPLLAVSTTNGRSTVTVARGTSTEVRAVTTGLTSGAMIEIKSGLNAGEQVVLQLPGARRDGNRNGQPNRNVSGNAVPGGNAPPDGVFVEAPAP